MFRKPSVNYGTFTHIHLSCMRQVGMQEVAPCMPTLKRAACTFDFRLRISSTRCHRKCRGRPMQCSIRRRLLRPTIEKRQGSPQDICQLNRLDGCIVQSHLSYILLEGIGYDHSYDGGVLCFVMFLPIALPAWNTVKSISVTMTQSLTMNNIEVILLESLQPASQLTFRFF